jgi:hypothetical protein
MPSQVPSNKRMEGCADGLPLMELRMRIAAAEATIVKWRNARRYRAHLVQQLYGNTGERAITRQFGLLLGVENTISRFIEEYRAHRAACLSLAPLDLSHKHLHEFKDSDNSGPIPDLDEVRLERQARKASRIGPNASRNAQANALQGLLPGQGQRITSWPWRMFRSPPDSVAQMAQPSSVAHADFQPNVVTARVRSSSAYTLSNLTVFQVVSDSGQPSASVSATSTTTRAPSSAHVAASASSATDAASAHALHVPNDSAEIAQQEELLFGLQQRTEWAKARARHQRWVEEKKLTLEEMRRTLAYLTYRATWWREQKDRRRNIAVPLADDPMWRVWSGCNAYAERQACLVSGLRNKFVASWRLVLHKLDLHPEWLSLYTIPQSPSSTADPLPDVSTASEPPDTPSSPGLELVSSHEEMTDNADDDVPVVRMDRQASSGARAGEEEGSGSSDNGERDGAPSAGSEGPNEEEDEDDAAGLDFTEG